MTLDYATPPPLRPHTGFRFTLFVLCAACLAFFAWCAADFLYVRLHLSLDVLFLVFPFAIAFAGRRIFHLLPPQARFLCSFGVLILSAILTVVLIASFGIPFHFWIGGQL